LVKGNMLPSRLAAIYSALLYRRRHDGGCVLISSPEGTT
jgi:hypothetical protein